MIFIGILAFSVVCSILKIRIESFLFAFPFMMIAAYFFFFRWPILDCRWNSDFYPFRRASTRRRQFCCLLLLSYV